MNIHKILQASVAVIPAILVSAPAQAQSEPLFYAGQIILTISANCPGGTLPAEGQQLKTSQYPALFAVAGYLYGGSGSTFYLPDMRGRRPVHAGQAVAGGNLNGQGDTGGDESVTLTVDQMPAHSHTGNVVASSGSPTSENPSGNALGTFANGQFIYTPLPASTGSSGDGGGGTSSSTAQQVSMGAGTVATNPTGGASATPILDPYIVLRFCVVVEGVFQSPSSASDL